MTGLGLELGLRGPDLGLGFDNWNNITISISHLDDEDNFIFLDRFATSFSSLLHDISIDLKFTFLLHLTSIS